MQKKNKASDLSLEKQGKTQKWSHTSRYLILKSSREISPLWKWQENVFLDRLGNETGGNWRKKPLPTGTHLLRSFFWANAVSSCPAQPCLGLCNELSIYKQEVHTWNLSTEKLNSKSFWSVHQILGQPGLQPKSLLNNAIKKKKKL